MFLFPLSKHLELFLDQTENSVPILEVQLSGSMFLKNLTFNIRI